MAPLRFGCSGWDYEEWIGPVYRTASESKLAAYARVFDTAEINSTFYNNPTKGMVLGWTRYSPETFVFAAKIPQTVTHDRRLDVAKGAKPPLDEFLDLMRPLKDAGKLGPLLLQLPPGLRFDEDRVRRFLEVLPADFRFALEPRHLSWMVPSAFDLLRAYGVAYCVVDEPLLPPDVHVTAEFAYLRWHGRGREPWYDYRYETAELEAWVPKVHDVAGHAKEVYGFFNNHFHGYAPENCLQVLQMLGALNEDQRRALKRIDEYRRGEFAPRTKPTTLEDFGGEANDRAEVERRLLRFTDRARLQRAKTMAEGVSIRREGSALEAMVKTYAVSIDRENKILRHDCDDWAKGAPRRAFCKHLAKVFLALPPHEASGLLDAMLAEQDLWRFEAASNTG